MPLEPDLATDLSLSPALAAPRHLIWACWTQPQHIPHFFVPRPHRVTSVAIGLRLGGRFDTTFDVDGTVMGNGGAYLQVEPERRRVFTDSYTEGWKPAPDPIMTAILLFSDIGDGGTVYTAIARHRTAKACKTNADLGFHEGRGTVATQLEAHAKGLMA